MTRIKPLIAAALALGSVAVVPAAQAQRYFDDGGRYAQPYRDDGYRGGAYRGDDGQPGFYRGDDDRPGYRQVYDRGGPRYDARGYRRCGDGATGTIVGALAGGLLGRAIDDRGDRALGTILGAGAGALAGRAIDRNGSGYCR